jgi:hypothetical protein
MYEYAFPFLPIFERMKEESNSEIDRMLKEASGKDLVLKTEPFSFRLVRKNTLSDLDSYAKDLAFIKNQKISAHFGASDSPFPPTEEMANTLSEATNTVIEERKTALLERIIEKRSRNFLDVDKSAIKYEVAFVVEKGAIKAKVQYFIPTFPYQCLGLITENRKLVLFYIDRNTPSFVDKYVVHDESTEVEFLSFTS